MYLALFFFEAGCGERIRLDNETFAPSYVNGLFTSVCGFLGAVDLWQHVVTHSPFLKKALRVSVDFNLHFIFKKYSSGTNGTPRFKQQILGCFLPSALHGLASARRVERSSGA